MDRGEGVPTAMGEGCDSLAICDSLLRALGAGGKASRDEAEARRLLNRLRKFILHVGLGVPSAASLERFAPGQLTPRGKVWKVLLGLGADRPTDVGHYASLVARGRCRKDDYKKIRSDTFRTYPQERLFQDRVSEAALVRVLSAFVHEHPGTETKRYRQGMNCFAAVFLFLMPEPDAYAAFCELVLRRTPLYWLNQTAGSEAGCMIMDEVLCHVDPELAAHLIGTCGLTAYVYAHPLVSVLYASIKPIHELIQLWDFLFAFGIHMAVLCVAAQVISLRESLLRETKAGAKRILDYRAWPALDSKKVIADARAMLDRLPAELLSRLAGHMTDASLCSQIIGREIRYVAEDP